MVSKVLEEMMRSRDRWKVRYETMEDRAEKAERRERGAKGMLKIVADEKKAMEANADAAQAGWDDSSRRNGVLLEFVKFVSYQSCTRLNPETGEGDDCTSSGDCITEWCWGCHARAVMKEVGDA